MKWSKRALRKVSKKVFSRVFREGELKVMLSWSKPWWQAWVFLLSRLAKHSKSLERIANWFARFWKVKPCFAKNEKFFVLRNRRAKKLAICDLRGPWNFPGALSWVKGGTTWKRPFRGSCTTAPRPRPCAVQNTVAAGRRSRRQPTVPRAGTTSWCRLWAERSLPCSLCPTRTWWTGRSASCGMWKGSGPARRVDR